MALRPPRRRQYILDSADSQKISRSNRKLWDSLISQLQQQIDDLTLFLEEERINHKETKRKSADHLRDRIDELTNQHANEVKILVDQHREEKESLLANHDDDMQEMQEKNDAAIEKMKGEISFLQGAFESFKTQLHIETTDKWNKKEDELRKQYDDKLQEKLRELKQKMLLEKNRENAETGKEHVREMHDAKKVHRKEMEALIRRYANAAADYEKLVETEKTLQETELRMSDLEKEYDATCREVTELTRDLTETKVKLLAFEESFGQKVHEIDEKYRHQMDELMAQNADLKRLYVKKCGQLYYEKTEAEKSRMEQVESAKETMKAVITSRHNAIISVAAHDPDLEHLIRPPKRRPVSAPHTKAEGKVAQLSAGETGEYVRVREEKTRPHTSKPRILEAIEREHEEGGRGDKEREEMKRILKGEK